MNQQGSEIGVIPFAHAQQILFAAAGMLSGLQAQPGCNLPATIEVLGIPQ